MTVVDLVLQLGLGIVLTAWVLRRDMRRLPEDAYARAWNDATFWSAVVVFGPLSIPVHFARTRRTLLGFLAGVLWAAAVLVAIGFVSDALFAIAGGRAGD